MVSFERDTRYIRYDSDGIPYLSYTLNTTYTTMGMADLDIPYADKRRLRVLWSNFGKGQPVEEDLKWLRRANRADRRKLYLYEHIWYSKDVHPRRKGQHCRIVKRGYKNTIVAEFLDGEVVTASRYAVRSA